MRMELTGEKWYNGAMVFDDFHRGEAILPPEEEAKLRAELEAALAENTSLKTENDALREQLAALKKAVYGQRSEKSEYVLEGGEQLSLFNEAECEENRREREREESIVVAPHTRKRKRTHDEMAANLPLEEVIHPAGASECDLCSSALQTMGKEFIRDELVYVPARLFVRKHHVEILKCTACGTDESKNATLPDVEKSRFFKGQASIPMIARSFSPPELLAHIAYSKYVLGLPLHRLENDFAALGVHLSRATMATG